MADVLPDFSGLDTTPAIDAEGFGISVAEGLGDLAAGLPGPLMQEEESEDEEPHQPYVDDSGSEDEEEEGSEEEDPESTEEETIDYSQGPVTTTYVPQYAKERRQQCYIEFQIEMDKY